jgi:hypothetical protein
MDPATGRATAGHLAEVAIGQPDSGRVGRVGMLVVASVAMLDDRVMSSTPTVPVHVSDRVAPGEVFTSFHFPDPPTNALTS